MRAIKARKHKRIKQKPFSSFFAEDIDEWDAWEKDQLAQEIAMGEV